MLSPATNEIDSRYQAVVASLPAADRAAIEAYEHAHSRPDLPDDDEDERTQPHAVEALNALLATRRREVNLLVAEALADHLGVSLVIGTTCAMFCWRLNMGSGWWKRTIAGWARDLGCSPDKFERARNAMMDGELVDCRSADDPAKPAMLRYKLDGALLHKIVYDYAVKTKLLIPAIKGALPQAAVMTLSPVDNYSEEMGSLPQDAVVVTARCGNPIEGKSLENHKTPPTPPADDFERSDAQTRKKTTDPAGILLAACGALKIPYDEPELRAFCDLADVTVAEAREVARQADKTASQIEGWTWFRAVILKNRMRPKPAPQATPIGSHASHTPGPALAQIIANEQRGKTAPDIAEPALRESLAALARRGYAGRKG